MALSDSFSAVVVELYLMISHRLGFYFLSRFKQWVQGLLLYPSKGFQCRVQFFHFCRCFVSDGNSFLALFYEVIGGNGYVTGLLDGFSLVCHGFLSVNGALFPLNSQTFGRFPL
jgi:hypothetical protein